MRSTKKAENTSLRQTPFLLLLCASFVSGVTCAAPLADPKCGVDRAAVLALDEEKFDQEEGGWRAVAATSGCELVAADLIRDYRQAHRNEATILYWHEGQLRAMAGQPRAAIAVMERSRKPADKDAGGWNPYVDATIAFLRRDKGALDKARSKLAAVAPPAGDDTVKVKDGFVELPTGDGKMIKIAWPPNLDVVNGLTQCFGKSYEVAYSTACRLRSN